MVIDPLELFGDYHLTPTRGRIKTVNWNLKGAHFSISRGRDRRVAAGKVARGAARGAGIRLYAGGAQHHGVAYFAAGGRDPRRRARRLHDVRPGGAASDRYR